ncbi:FxSxx-COOH system tetratricopeptide repeat protein [Streptomyces sp. NBC_01808]|uniref:FxSxx-COOH system tetratricopeptide repeat protein n=1 Tax=Streptomyces sp. NBC_01808 TaxID=2975947 RepID=UPI002DD9C992|nr:FxSxx-COOH system tetratricopeptide repeat protein [Streptomyces sp. NBC_01808]WSA40556.1 FxSxx-COOH system tetratricopeptide repeat protein [Streptomyces sp. NBC_01808]
MAKPISISYAGFNRPWAAWIAHQLELLGHPTSMLRWSPEAGRPLADELAGLLAAPDRILLVLDDWFFGLGPRGEEEWNEALRTIVPQHGHRFAAASVATDMPVAAAALAPVDLRDLGTVEARRRVLTRLGIDPDAPVRPDREPERAPRFPNDPPVVFNTPRRNYRFTGRDDILEQLHGTLSSAGQGARIALSGISGVGKSQIAVEYTHRFGNDYDVVWFVNASYRMTAREQLADLSVRLNLPVGSNIGDRLRRVREALRSGRPYRRWLVVFDSADEMELIDDIIPEGDGHVLITTRTRDWAVTGGAEEIEVPHFTRAESTAFARRRAPRLTETEADGLAEAVQDLPLVLSQTAAWLDSSTMAPADYIELLREKEPGKFGISIGSDYPMGFLTSWSITLNGMREKTPAAAAMLNLFACFSPDSIPVSRIVERSDQLPRHLAELAGDPISWHSALRRLSESTAVTIDYLTDPSPETEVEKVQMHRLYHRFLRSDLPEDEREAMSATACRILAAADPRRPTDTREWARYAELLPHLEPAGAMESADPAVQELVLHCINYLLQRGEYRAALKMCELTLAPWTIRLEPTHRSMITLVHSHAEALRNLGRYRESEAVGRRLVEVLSPVRDEEDPDLLSARNGLGGALLGLGEYQTAREIFDDVRQKYAGLLGADHPRTMSLRSNLASALALLGRYEDALEIYRVLLVERERRLRTRHHQTMASGTRYAWMLRLLGHYEEAHSRQQRNAALHRQIMGEHNPQTLRAEHNLALCLRRLGKLAEADRAMESVVERFTQVQGPRHPETLMVEADYATFLREHRDLHRARELAESVNRRYEAMLGEQHPYTAGTLGNVGLALWPTGDWQEASEIAELALTRMTAAVGPAHPWTLGCALNAAAARNRLDAPDHAEELSRQTVDTVKEVLGARHPMALSAMMALADDLRSLRRSQEAKKVEREAMQNLSDTLGVDHPHTLASRRRERPYWDFEPQPT